MAKIKICGLFREEDIAYANEAGPDYIGFVFAPKSRRFVSPASAPRLREKLREGITPVGVFVNADINEVAGLYENGTISVIQLHGGESDEYIAELRERCGAPIIQALNAEELANRHDTPGSAVSGLADYILVDNGSGGTGKSFDWRLLDTLRESASARTLSLPPLFLAGGIGLHNIEAALAYNPFCVDISGGAESGGVKEREKIIRLVERGCRR
jgi:phosphoribosylanthranilate isomerase